MRIGTTTGRTGRSRSIRVAFRNETRVATVSILSVARRNDGYASLYGCMLGMMAPVIYLARHARTASASDHSAPPILDSNPAGSRRELARGRSSTRHRDGARSPSGRREAGRRYLPHREGGGRQTKRPCTSGAWPFCVIEDPSPSIKRIAGIETLSPGDQLRDLSTSFFSRIQGIMSRRRSPTASIWCSSPSRRIAFMDAAPAWFSRMNSLAN